MYKPYGITYPFIFDFKPNVLCIRIWIGVKLLPNKSGIWLLLKKTDWKTLKLFARPTKESNLGHKNSVYGKGGAAYSGVTVAAAGCREEATLWADEPSPRARHVPAAGPRQATLH